ncbi:hypothetical protein DRW03_16310 [Corallococcus sp. H22C18031201]|nr:hypothetical protein DRW03_16310 [Corallococcus sp. H22C18031201]
MSSKDYESRANKLARAFDGEDEFSIFSVDPDARKLKVELTGKKQEDAPPPPAPENPAEQPSEEGAFMRLFRKMFKG